MTAVQTPDPSCATARSTRWQWVVAIVLSVGLPLAYLQTTNSTGRDVVLGLGVACLLALLFARKYVRPLRPTARLVGIAIVASVVTASLLAHGYKRYLRSGIEVGPRSEAFRKSLAVTHWPVYGLRDWGRWPHALVLLPAGGVLGWWALRRGRRLALEENRNMPALAGLCAASALAMFACGFSERPDRWRGVFGADNQFVQDAAQFASIYEVMASYRQRMDGLSWFGQHYPPGNMLVLGWLGVGGKYLYLLAAGLTPALTWLAMRSLGGSRPAAWWSAALAATAPLLVMLSSVTTTVLVVPLSAGGLWLAGLCTDHPQHQRLTPGALLAATGLGVVAAAWTFFSFGVAVYLFMLVVMVAMLIWARQVSIVRALICASVAAIAMVVALLALWLASGYDTLAVFREATANHFEQIGGRKLPPDEPLLRWLIRGLGNLVAFWFGHLPMTAVALLGLPLARRGAPAVAFAMPAILVTMLIAGFTGTFTLETERVWLFLVPPVILTAGFWLAQREVGADSATPIAVVTIAVLMLVVIEVSYWPYL